MKFPNFQSRSSFTFDDKLIWYPGNQAKAMKQLKKGIGHVDLVIEVRDARIPFSSANPTFEKVLGNRSRLIVFNKCDLSESRYQSKLTSAFSSNLNEKIVFTSTKNPKSVKSILQHAIGMCKNNPHIYPTLSMVVVGLPNVGKSSLLNKLRNVALNKGKVAQVGPTAGVTKTIQTRVKVWNDPALYIVDTPGVLCPSVVSPMEGLKIALTGGTKDRMTNRLFVADYLLYRLNNHSQELINNYVELYKLDEPTDNIDEFIKHLAVVHNLGRGERLFRITKNQDDLLDIEGAIDLFIRDFRLGKLGQLTLDDCSTNVIHDWFKNQQTAWK